MQFIEPHPAGTVEADALETAAEIFIRFLCILATVNGIRWGDDDDADVRLALRGIVAAARG